MKQIFFGVLVAFSLLPFAVNAQGDASIKIIKPGDRRNVQLGEVNVSVEISGVSLQDGYAWQMLIDAVPQGIVRAGTTTTITMPKPTGPHHLTAQLLNPEGQVISLHDILVIAAPVESRQELFNRAWFAPFMFVFSLGVLAIILLALRVRLRPLT